MHVERRQGLGAGLEVAGRGDVGAGGLEDAGEGVGAVVEGVEELGDEAVGAVSRPVLRLHDDAGGVVGRVRRGLGVRPHAEAAGAQKSDQLVARIEELKEKKKADAKRQTGLVPTAQAAVKTAELLHKGAFVSVTGGFRSMDELRAWAKEVRSSMQSGVIAAGLDDPENPQLFVTVSDDLVEQGVDAGELVKDAATQAGGKGGGKAGMAQGKVPEPQGLQTALARLRERLQG